MRLIPVILLMLVAGCGDPIVMLPGGALKGEPTAAPADWSALANIKTIQVEFRPDDPYSHNIWGVGIGSDLYIATGADGTRWTPFVATDPRVKVRVGTALYDLIAVPVTDAAERARVSQAYVQKYELKPEDQKGDELVFRLDRP
jgi:hypothetical protein